jgi:hypothetical protein
MNLRAAILFFLLVSAMLLSSGCSVTPHANIGVDLTISDGKLRLRPDAHVGIYGSP